MVDDDSAGDRRTLSQWLTHIQSVHFRSIDLTLDRVQAVLQRLLPGGPAYTVVSVAGTNGKGSAVEMLTAIYAQTDLCVGTYTSPHLISFTERIQVNRRAVAEFELCVAFEKIELLRSGIPLTYFEFSTLAALLIFQHRGVQIALLEVGMGGRLDAVNAVDPSVSLITSVAIDHQLWLGSDRESIAAEKVGISRESRPVICSDPDPPEAIARQANKIGARLYQINEHFSYVCHEQLWDWVGPECEFKHLPRPPMTGAFQLQNAAGVLMTLMALNHRIRVTAEHLRSGLASTRLRGRFDLINGEPMIVLDVAHNAAAISQLKANLEASPVAGRTLAVCGMLRDKPVAGMAAQLAAVVDAWYLGTIRDPRGYSANELGQIIATETTKQVLACGSVVSAYNTARSRAAAADRIVVFGSFHTVGDIMRLLRIDSVVH